MGNIDSMLCIKISRRLWVGLKDLESDKTSEMGTKLVAPTARKQASRVIEVGVWLCRIGPCSGLSRIIIISIKNVIVEANQHEPDWS